MADFIIEYWLEIGFGLVVAFMGFLYRSFTKVIHNRERKQEAIEQGIIALLKERLLDLYNQYSDKGYFPIHARDRTDILFEAYSQLGGNGTVKGLVKKLKELPVEKEEASH